MSKGLKEFRRLKYYVGQVMIRDKEIANSKLLNSLCDFDKSCDIIEQELRAFEICLKRKPDLCAICYQLPTYECYLEYMKGVEDESFILEEDEYELLREILL